MSHQAIPLESVGTSTEAKCVSVHTTQYINESEDGSESEESDFDMDEINDHIHPNIIESLSDDDE